MKIKFLFLQIVIKSVETKNYFMNKWLSTISRTKFTLINCQLVFIPDDPQLASYIPKCYQKHHYDSMIILIG